VTVSDLIDPNAGDAAPPPDPNAYDLKGKSNAKLYLAIIGVLLACGGGFAGYRMVSQRNHAKEHAAFMQSFQDLDKDDVGQFWACLIGPNLDPGIFPDNLALGGKIEGGFQTDPKGFPDKVLDTCIPKLKGLDAKATGLTSPPEYTDALAKYGKSLPALADGIKDWAEHAKTRIPEREADAAVEKAGTAFHGVEGKPAPEAIAYARFLRCAVPDLDKVKDEQALLQRLFDDCKKPEFVQKARFECSKVAASTDGKDDKQFRGVLKKFGPDDRDVTAFSDCFRKGRKGAKRDAMAAFAKAWAAYLEAGSAVKKIGAANLKND
jgi:hypothetical protein